MTNLLLLSIFLLAPFAQTGINDPNRFNEFLMLAYFVMGAIGVIYVASLFIRQRNLEKDIHLMKQLLMDEEEISDS